jgi:hypothetical protein
MNVCLMNLRKLKLCPRSNGFQMPSIVNYLEKDFKINWLAIFVELFCKLKTTRKLTTNCHFNSPKAFLTFSFISLTIFTFKLTPIILYKYLCLCFNKSALYWTFCQSLLWSSIPERRKTQLHKN